LFCNNIKASSTEDNISKIKAINRLQASDIQNLKRKNNNLEEELIEKNNAIINAPPKADDDKDDKYVDDNNNDSKVTENAVELYYSLIH
jgi:hypothetical protein